LHPHTTNNKNSLYRLAPNYFNFVSHITKQAKRLRLDGIKKINCQKDSERKALNLFCVLIE